MPAYYMALGVNQTETGSMDTFFANQTSVSDNPSYVAIGNRNLATPRNTYYFTSGSNGSGWNYPSSTGSMYTPFPTGTERGKLYLIAIDDFDDALTGSLPIKTDWVTLHTPATGYFILTPTLNDPSLNLSRSIALYAFEDVDDLFQNGWRITKGTSDTYDPLVAESTWDTIVQHGGWSVGGLIYNDPDPVIARRSKEQIVACTLAMTAKSLQIQGSAGLSGANLLRGALVIPGDDFRDYDSAGWKGIVPFTDALVTP